MTGLHVLTDLHRNSERQGAAAKVVCDQREEMNLYQTYSEHYSYGFNIARKS